MLYLSKAIAKQLLHMLPGRAVMIAGAATRRNHSTPLPTNSISNIENQVFFNLPNPPPDASSEDATSHASQSGCGGSRHRARRLHLSYRRPRAEGWIKTPQYAVCLRTELARLLHLHSDLEEIVVGCIAIHQCPVRIIESRLAENLVYAFCRLCRRQFGRPADNRVACHSIECY